MLKTFRVNRRDPSATCNTFCNKWQRAVQVQPVYEPISVQLQQREGQEAPLAGLAKANPQSVPANCLMYLNMWKLESSSSFLSNF